MKGFATSRDESSREGGEAQKRLREFHRYDLLHAVTVAVKPCVLHG